MGAHVDTFEPNPLNFLRACESICLNGWVDGVCNAIGMAGTNENTGEDLVRIFPLGIGNNETTVLFDGGFRQRKNPGAGGIVLSKAMPDSSRAKYSEINVTTLDVMAREIGWFDTIIDIMKIDVEGYEIHVIRGAHDLIRSKRIRNIFMEGDVHGPWKKKHFREIIRTLVGAGYSIFKIGGYSGPDTHFAPSGEDIEEELLFQCEGGGGPKRKKCNIWWKLPNV